MSFVCKRTALRIFGTCIWRTKKLKYLKSSYSDERTCMLSYVEMTSWGCSLLRLKIFGKCILFIMRYIAVDWYCSVSVGMQMSVTLPVEVSLSNPNTPLECHPADAALGWATMQAVCSMSWKLIQERSKEYGEKCHRKTSQVCRYLITHPSQQMILSLGQSLKKFWRAWVFYVKLLLRS